MSLSVVRGRRTIAMFAALCLVLTTFIVTAEAADAKRKADPPGQLVQVQLLAFNDYHGHVEDRDAGVVDGEPAG